ncbi:hypothetical protein Tco_0578797 [Tanacetum coccineum]
MAHRAPPVRCIGVLGYGVLYIMGMAYSLFGHGELDENVLLMVFNQSIIYRVSTDVDTAYSSKSGNGREFFKVIRYGLQIPYAFNGMKVDSVLSLFWHSKLCSSPPQTIANQLVIPSEGSRFSRHRRHQHRQKHSPLPLVPHATAVARWSHVTPSLLLPKSGGLTSSSIQAPSTRSILNHWHWNKVNANMGELATWDKLDKGSFR